MSTVLQIANADKNLVTFMKALKIAGLETELGKHGPFTIFAPVNLAFRNMTPDSFEDLSKPANTSKLSEVLTFHVLAEKKLLKDLRNGQKLRTINGQELVVTVDDNGVRINGAKVLSKDRQAGNGVVHSIDAVNIPAVPVAMAAAE